MAEPKLSLKNDLLLKALRGEPVNRPPVWMMRQAGRYLPDYVKLQEKYSFFERCETPELAAEITIMPIEQIGSDAAILFSDILVVAKAMDFEVTIEKGEGPVIHNQVGRPEQVAHHSVPDVRDRLNYVFDAIRMIQNELDKRVPLIGFAGAPWTIFCYLVEGRGSKDFAKAKAFCMRFPKESARLLDLITRTTILYLKEQVKAGVDALQLFDSWAGLLGPSDFEIFSYPYLQQIANEIKSVPLILFAKGCWYALDKLQSTGAAAIGLDWTVSPEYARNITGNRITLQGNYDPAHLLGPVDTIRNEVREMIDRFGKRRYIVNLGHGILPQVPVDHARAFVDAVKEYD